jgi:cephalosporin-C deacetylase-like acetyl esterase
MKKFRYCIFSVFISFGFIFNSNAQRIDLIQTNESGIYKNAQKIDIKLFVHGQSSDSVYIKIQKNNLKETVSQAVKFKGDTLLVFTGTFYEPTSMIFEATAKGESASIGLIVEPLIYKPGTSRPKDFDQYWRMEKKALRKLPVEVKSVPVNVNEAGYKCSDVEINCTGPKPARGYFAKPENALPKSLPIVLYLHAAGVAGSWCRSEVGNAMRYAKIGNGALSFDLNAHGMLNGQSEEYYKNLETGELKNYYISGIENRNDVYFRGMYLRLIRTLDFLTSQPEWDRRRILVIGESQGGGQAFAAAGLDHRVGAAVAIVPAMCDWGGTLLGRKGGWPQPFDSKNDKDKMIEAIPYFDTAHLLKGCKATLVTEIGLIDNTCPSTSIYAAINQAIGKKISFVVPYRAHQMAQPAFKETWGRNVGQPREAFIKDYLD